MGFSQYICSRRVSCFCFLHQPSFTLSYTGQQSFTSQNASSYPSRRLCCCRSSLASTTSDRFLFGQRGPFANSYWTSRWSQLSGCRVQHRISRCCRICQGHWCGFSKRNGHAASQRQAHVLVALGIPAAAKQVYHCFEWISANLHFLWRIAANYIRCRCEANNCPIHHHHYSIPSLIHHIVGFFLPNSA